MKFNFYVLYILIAVFTFTSGKVIGQKKPALQWGTYYGGTGFDFGNSVTTDKDGNVYIGGRTKSINAISTLSIGVIPNDYYGFVAKFNSNGVRQWGIYVAGEVNDLACDDEGNVYVVGSTRDIALTNDPNVHQSTYGGGLEDAFVVKLNSSGMRVWATYYGGTSLDYANSVAVDVNNDVYIAGVTVSSNANSIATPGAHKQSIPTNNTNQIFFLAKLNSSGNRIWGTYYGSEVVNENFNDVDEPYSINITTDISRNVYIAGSTYSTAGIATNNAHLFFKNGGALNRDGFIARFTPAGVRSWGTYYGGPENDYIGDVVCDLAGNVYFSGLTRSLAGIASTGAQQGAYISGNTPLDLNIMLGKFRNTSPTTAVRDWGTYYGSRSGIPGTPNSRGMSGGIAIDPSGALYFSGAKAINTSQDHFGMLDIELSRFNTAQGKVEYDTIIGHPDYFDFGAALAVDPSGNVLIAGSTLSPSNINTAGSHQPAIGGDVDAFLIKFRNSDTAVYFKDLHLLKTAYCYGDTFSIPYGITYPFKAGNIFTAQLYNGTNYLDIGSRASTDSGKIFCTIPSTVPLTNPIKIRIVASNPADTTVENSLIITIGPKPSFTLSGDTSVCEGGTISLLALPTTNYTFSWVGPNSFTSNVFNPVIINATLAATGDYVVSVTRGTGSCSVKDTISVVVKPIPAKPQILVDSTVCEGDTLFLRATGTPAEGGYQWTGPNGFSVGTLEEQIYIPAIYLNATGLYYVSSLLHGCTSDTASAWIKVKPQPRFSFISNDPICEGDTLRIKVLTNANDSVFRWLGPNGYTSYDTNVVIYNTPYDNRGDYTLAAGLDGCVGYGVKGNVKVKPKPRFMATSNSPIYEGEDLKLDIEDELFPGSTFVWTGPDSFLSGVRSPVRDTVTDDLSGTYHVKAILDGCVYVGLTNVIIYRLNYDEFMLYPIPNNGNFTVAGTVKNNAPINVQIANSANQLIGYDMIYPEKRRFKKEYWLEDNLANGQYYFRAKVNGKWKVVPFTILK